MHNPLWHLRSLFLKKRPIHLTFFVTRRCNASCAFCFYEAASGAAHLAPELTADEVRRVAGSLDRLLWVLFSGGEPFLREDLAELSETFHDRNRAAFLTYPTNGLMPERVAEATAEILKRCPDSVVVVKLSLDGIGSDHDELRRVPGAFDRLMRCYERLAALADRNPRLELGVNTLFCRENQRRMDAIVEFVGRLDRVRSHTVTLVRGDRSGGVDLGEYQRVSRALERERGRARRLHRFAGARLKAAQDRLQHRLIHRTAAQRRRFLPCYAGRLNLVLTESGELHPCEGLWHRSFGNVRDVGYDVRELLRSERAGRVLDEIRRGACWCSHECNMLTNILFNPRMQPALAGEYAWLRFTPNQPRRWFA